MLGTNTNRLANILEAATNIKATGYIRKGSDGSVVLCRACRNKYDTDGNTFMAVDVEQGTECIFCCEVLY